MSRPANHAAYAALREYGRVLPAVWAITDVAGPVPDVEALARGVMLEVRPRDPSRFEDADVLQIIFAEVVVLRGEYVQAPGREFRPFAYQRLRWKLRDYYRSEEGRQGQKHRPDSLDGAAFRDAESPSEDRLASLASGSPGDDPDTWAADCGGLLDLGDREAQGSIGQHGDGEASGARAGHPRAGRGPWVDCPACGWRSYLSAPNGHPGWTPLEQCSGCGTALEVAA